MASNKSSGDKYYGYQNSNSSLESPKKKEEVTGESEVKPQKGVTNQDQGISLDRSSQEKTASDQELESFRKKIKEDTKRYQLMIEKREAEKKENEQHQSAEHSDVGVKTDDISDSDFVTNEPEEIRIVLVGHTGNGKSSTGNTILGEDVFKASDDFVSATGVCSIKEATRGRKKIIVVDTPGLEGTEMNNEETLKEIRKCVGVCLPGPHAIIFVLQIGKRFTTEEEQSVTQLEKLFKDKFYEFVIVLFTKKDSLKSGETLDQRLSKIPKSLKNILEKAKNRTIGFCNDKTNTTEYMTQVDELFAAINALGENKEIKYYTDSNLKKLEKGIKKKRKEKKDEEIRNEILQEGESYSIVKKYFCC